MKVYGFALALVPLIFAVSCRNAGESGAAESGGKLAYSPQVNEVEVVTLKKEDFQLQLLSNGKLSAVRKCQLKFSHAGVITEVNAVNGQSVQKGFVIARMDDTEERSSLASARVELDRASLELQDFLTGYGYKPDGGDAPADFLESARIRTGYSVAKNNLDKAQGALDATVLKAPFSGKLADLKYKTFDTFGGEAFCSVIDDSEFDVDFTILESEYSSVAKGQEVRITLMGGGSGSCSGRVTSVNPSIDRQGQINVTARVRGTAGLVDGMNVKVMVCKTIEKQFVVPKSAVVIRDGLEVMFRYRDGRSEWVYVITEDANSESYVIRANEDRGAAIEEGDLVIVSGNLNLADGSEVALKQE